MTETSAHPTPHPATPHPARRLLGSLASWTVFVFSVTSLLQVTAIVMSLGGSCASGGPYAIEVECPDSVVLFAPASSFGFFIGWGIAIALSGGFGASVLTWGWSILFVSLGAQFVLSGVLQGSVLGWVLGIFNLAMGLVPLWFWWKQGPRSMFIGTHDLWDRPFTEELPKRRLRARKLDGPVVPVTPAAVALGVSVPVLGILLGAGLSLLAVGAAATAG